MVAKYKTQCATLVWFCKKKKLFLGTCNSWRNHLRKYESKIQKIFRDPAASEGSGGAPAVKSEPVFETEHEDVYQSTSSRDHGKSQVRFKTRETINRQSNPIGKDGKVLRCFKL